LPLDVEKVQYTFPCLLLGAGKIQRILEPGFMISIEGPNMNQEKIKKKKEYKTLLYFSEAYERITGKEFVQIYPLERPDFLCKKQNGKIVGVELTQVRRGHPETFDWDRIIDNYEHMKVDDALKMIQQIVDEKENKRKEADWKCPDSSMLIIEFNDIPLDLIQKYLNRDMLPDIYQTGFCEIWIVDLTCFEAFGDVELFCFRPERYEGYYPRPFQKPYG
jgi:hypothetical protein